jgi:hypothetical protein
MSVQVISMAITVRTAGVLRTVPLPVDVYRPRCRMARPTAQQHPIAVGRFTVAAVGRAATDAAGLWPARQLAQR